MRAAAPGAAPFRTALLRLRLSDETTIASALEAVAAVVGGAVALGSYPVSSQADGAGIVLSLESRSEEALNDACERLKAALPQGALLSEHRDCAAINTPLASPAAGGGGDAAAATGGSA